MDKIDHSLIHEQQESLCWIKLCAKLYMYSDSVMLSLEMLKCT